MWNVAPVIFDDEDEEVLKTDFIRLCALYPDKDIFEIGVYVFRNQVDPEMRSRQAAAIWSKDIEIQERIRIARLNGGVEPEPIDEKETQLRKLQAIYNDDKQPLKERLLAMRLHAEISGRIVKAIDKVVDNKNKGPVLPTFVIAQYTND